MLMVGGGIPRPTADVSVVVSKNIAKGSRPRACI